ncbi:hypothetical protein [Maribacter sp. 2307ULW6-5]|uniref:hypothetical protein n=1 Tax=Maribacter sp. 2307ULW6-5 TaxID=3386275 RepID=UPI0039BCEABC
MTFFYKLTANIIICCFSISIGYAQVLPKILDVPEMPTGNYVPNFSYAGYAFGEAPIPEVRDAMVLATDHGVVANDGPNANIALVNEPFDHLVPSLYEYQLAQRRRP